MSDQILTQALPKSKEKTPLTIIVNGNSSITRTAERAIVNIQVSTEGNDQETVSKEVTSTSKALQKLFDELAPKTDSGQPIPEAPVTSWTMRSLYTGSYRPRDAQGVDLERKYTANTAFELEFRDFSKLGAVTMQLLAMPNVSLYETTWRLTEETKESLGSQSRKEAMQDAMLKAKDFAEAAGCKEVTPFEISDGYLSVVFGRDTPQRARQFGAAEDTELSFAPEDVQLKSDVTVKFHAE
jgi:uncharacterized protein YggE